MKEKILKIEEIENYQNLDDDWCHFDGFKITTDQQEILLLISNDQSCCERWGYFMSEDDLEDFIGTKLLGIEIVDTALNKSKYEAQVEDACLDEGDVLFVNLETDKGTLQFTAYNAHNGYYGHEAIVKSTQLTKGCRL